MTQSLKKPSLIFYASDSSSFGRPVFHFDKNVWLGKPPTLLQRVMLIFSYVTIVTSDQPCPMYVGWVISCPDKDTLIKCNIIGTYRSCHLEVTKLFFFNKFLGRFLIKKMRRVSMLRGIYYVKIRTWLFVD